MKRNRRKKPRSQRSLFWPILLFFTAAAASAWWLWTCLYQTDPAFHYLLIKKNEQTLKVLNGETLPLNPKDRIRLLKIATNICFNHGMRLYCEDLDVNAIRLEEMAISALLSDRDPFDRYQFQIRVKRFNQALGGVNLIVEPDLKDWLARADRIIDHEKRIGFLEKALAHETQNQGLKDRLLQEYKTHKMWDKAARMLEKSADQQPDPDVLQELLDLYEAQSNTKGILSVMNRLLSLNPNQPELRYKLAGMLEKTGRRKAAITEYEKVLKGLDKEDRLPVYKTLGYLYTETGQFAKAIEKYLGAVDLEKKDANLYYNLAALYERVGRKDKADTYLDKAVRLDSGDLEGRLKLAERSFEKGHLDQAREYLKQVLGKKPDLMEALLLLVKVHEKRGDKKGLADAYRKILDLTPDNETVIYNLGILEYESGHFQDSLPYLKKYLNKHPDDGDVHGILFDIYKRQKKEDLAYAEARILYRLNPKDKAYLFYMLDYLGKGEQYRKMIPVLQKALKSHPGEKALMELLLLAYLKTGQNNRAMDQMKEMLKSRPKDLDLLLKLARLQDKQGITKEAAESYRKILNLSAEHKEAKASYIRLLLEQADDHEAKGNVKEALALYKEIMERSPGHEKAEEAYLRLRLQGIAQ